MKKLVLAVAVLAVASLSTNANTVRDNNPVEAVAVSQEVKTIKLEELPEASQEVIKKELADYTIKTISVDDQTKTVKIVVEKDGAEKVFILNAENKLEEQK